MVHFQPLLVAPSAVVLLSAMLAAGNLAAQDRCEFGNHALFQWRGGECVEPGLDLSSPLTTDRPDFTEAASTVGARVAQLEFGYTYSYDSEAGTSVRGHSFPEALLRYGMLRNWLELRIGLNYAEETTRTAGAGASLKGAEDLYLGFKIGLTAQDGLLPEMALIPQATVPTGSAAFNQNQMLGGLNWIYGWELNDRWSMAGSTQVNRSVDSITNDTYSEVAQSAVVGTSLTDRVGAYAEWYGLFPTSADTQKPELYFNGGFTYLVSNDFQIDVRAGVGLNGAADDYFVGVGGVLRHW